MSDELLPLSRVAEILNVSVGYAIELCRSGELRCDEEDAVLGFVPRVRRSALDRYKAVVDARASAALDEMVRLGEEMGLHD